MNILRFLILGSFIIIISFMILNFQEYLTIKLSILLFILYLTPLVIILYTPAHVLNPLLPFSIYYYVLIFSTLPAIKSYSNRIDLLETAVIMVYLSYIFFVLGFLLAVNKKLFNNPIRKINNMTFPIKLTKIFIFLFFSIAIINYIFIVYKTVNLEIWTYYKNLGYYGRNLKEIFGLSSLGYIFIYPAIYMLIFWAYKYKLKLYFYVFFIIYALIILSLGKITNFILSIIIPLIIFLTLRKKIYISFKHLFFAFFFFMSAIFLFLYRMFADISRVKEIPISEALKAINNIEFFNSIFFGKSNLPNINIIIFLLENWEEKRDFLKGMSLINIFSAILPSNIRTTLVQNYSVSWIIKNEWFLHEQGGAVPPTIIGELFANFSFLGIFFMFLIGIIAAIIYNFTFSKPSYIKLIFYTYFQWKFVFLMAKGEFSRISDTGLIFTLITLFLIKELSKLKLKEKIYV